MEAMTRHRSHSAAFKRQVGEEFIAGETLHALSKRHDISRQLVQIWVGKFEAGALDDDVRAAHLIQEYEAKIAALERMVDRQALELERLMGVLKHAPRLKSAATSVVTGPVTSRSAEIPCWGSSRKRGIRGRIICFLGPDDGMGVSEQFAGYGDQDDLGRSVKNLGRYAASWIACWRKRPSSTAALT